MKKITILGLLLLFLGSLSAQPIINLGLKAGVNNSKITANFNEFDSESILKMHVGAFARLGYGRIYVQPEAYFIAKGGKLESNVTDMITRFDFNNVDVPVLLGAKVLDGTTANLRIMAGPVFSFMTSNDVYGDTRFTTQYFKDHYFGFQYGIGIDFWNFFLDARIEQGSNNLYESPNLNSKNRSFMVSLGFKLL